MDESRSDQVRPANTSLKLQSPTTTRPSSTPICSPPALPPRPPPCSTYLAYLYQCPHQQRRAVAVSTQRHASFEVVLKTHCAGFVSGNSSAVANPSGVSCSGFGRKRKSFLFQFSVINEHNKKLFFFEGAPASRAGVLLVKAFPAGLAKRYQWRWPQGGSTGCWAREEQARQWQMVRAGKSCSVSSEVAHMQMKMNAAIYIAFAANYQLIYLSMRSQHQHKPTRPTLEQIQAGNCQVCFVAFDRALPRKLEEGVDILFCTQCHITVHKCCYDFEPNSTLVTPNVSEFLCDRCKTELPKGVTCSCLVCFGQDGPMKAIGGQEFVHVYCGLVHNDIDVVSYYPTLSFRKSLQYEELSNICEICMKRNAHDQCAEESCRRKVHTYCAKRTYAQLAAESDEPHSWNHHVSAGNHGNFDLSDEIIPFELFSEEVEQSIKEVNETGLELPSREQFKRNTHKEYLDELRGRRKSTKKLRRGGFSYVLCSQHQSTAYCVCQSKEEGEMVLCECCFEWYHQKCINFTLEDPDERFICHYCRVFFEFKKKAVDEVRGGRSDSDLSKAEMPLRFSVADCMWLVRVVDNRIRGGQAAKMVKQLSKYPLKSSCMELLIRQQSRQRLFGLAEGCVREWAGSSGMVAGLRPRAVLGLDGTGAAVVLAQNVAYNLKVRRVVELLNGVGLPGEFVSALLAELDFKQQAVSDSYETIIELSKSEQPYQEVTILKQKAQAYNFIDILHKIDHHHSIPYSHLAAALEKMQNSPNTPPYMLKALNDKLARVAPLVERILSAIQENPQNMHKINSTVLELEQQHIQPPLQYLQLRIERKFVQDLYLYYQKHHSSHSDHQLSISQQTDLLLAWTHLKPSQELIQIVNSYKPIVPNAIHPNVAQLASRCHSTVLQYQVNELLKRKVCKQERLLQIMERAQQADLQYHSQQVKNFINGWVQVKKQIDTALNHSLENAQLYEDISEMLLSANLALAGLDNIGIRIQEEGKTSLTSQLRTRKQDLQQLQILLTEAQLQKNPLTLQKLSSSLPKNNTLVKQYHHLKKQHSNLVNKYTGYLAKISQRIELFKSDSKKQRKDQIRQNSEKPSLSEVKELIELLRLSQIDMGRQIKQLNRMLSNTLEIANKVRKYCEEKQDFSKVSSIEELNLRRKDIDQLRRKVLMVAELSLKTELTDLYHLEISLRMKNALLTPTLQQEKIGFLLKVAEEQAMTHDTLYLQLKDRFETKNLKSKEVNQAKQLESMLAAEAARDVSGNLAFLSNYRRGLPLLDPAQIKIKNSYVEDLVEKNKLLRTKISNILSGRTKVEFQQAKPIYLEALKNPFGMPELSKFSQEFNKTFEILRRWKQTKNLHSLSQPIFTEYQHSLFQVQEIQKLKKELRSNEEEINHLKFMVESFSVQTSDQMEDTLERMEANPVIKDTEVCLVGQQQYIRYWIKLINNAKQAKIAINYDKFRRVILDAYNLLQRTLKRGQDYNELTPLILDLEKYLLSVKAHLRSFPKFTSENTLVEGFIDLEDFYLENEQEPDLADLVPLYKPFDDMPKFRVRNLQRVEAKREQISMKRSHSKLDDLRGSSDRNIVLQLSSEEIEDGPQVPQTVSDNERRKIKEIFLKNIRKNSQLRKYGECENEVKMIQNQIFGEWHNDIVKYFQMSQQFEKLFIKLVNCPNISNKITKKKFDFHFIQLLVTNLQKIDELEGMMIKNNKEHEAVRTINQAVPAPVVQQMIPQAIQESAIKIDETAREDLKKQMKMIKESRDGKQSKHKKKKHHKHKDKSRSPDAKFSSDSEKQLPKYIENQYNNKQEEKTVTKIDLLTSRISQSPLRYDPQEQEIQKRETIFPKGSILKLKNCEAEIQTRKRGRQQFSIDLYTQEQHRKVLELVDPGFTKLPIRKQKNESDILPYISKSRKKYRFLVGWFEASNPQQNELLREVAQEAVEKKKVFGWQSQHIKLHMMAVKQFISIQKMIAPARVTSKLASQQLLTDRMVFVLQYPQRLYEIRDQYKNFENIACSPQEYSVDVPVAAIQVKPINDYYHNYTVPTIEPLIKPAFKEPQVVYETWGSEPSTIQTTPLLSIPQPQPPSQPQQPQQQYGIHPRLNQARNHYGFGNYSPILTDSEDNQEDKGEREDLAANLLNSLDNPKTTPTPSASIPREKAQQQYQGYYGGYGSYQAPPQQQPRPMPVENRWMGYPQMGQSQPQSVYNPLNPMAPKFNNQMPPNPMSQGQMGQQQIGQQPMGQGQMNQPGLGGMFKNPMMGQRNPQMGGMGGQYYDPRYQGYQHPQ